MRTAAPLPETEGVPARTQPRADVQQLWFACQQRSWSSLAVVPSHRLGSSTYLARALVEVGTLAQSGQVDLLDAEGAGLEDTARLLSLIRAAHGADRRLVIALESVLYNQVSIALATAADAHLLCVDLGSDLESARKTLELIGTDKLLGCASMTVEAGR